MISLDLVTPSKKLIDSLQVSAVKIPAISGEIEVLPGHAELLTTLSNGILSFRQDGREKRYAVSYGFAEIRKDKVMVLAETCEEASEIDIGRAQSAQKRAEEALSGVLTEGSFKKHRLKLERAIIRQQVSKI